MKEIKKFCNTCKEEKYIIEIEKYPGGESIRLSCGHKIVSSKHFETIKLFEISKWKHKRPGYKKPIAQGKQRTKISRKTKRPVRENYSVNRIKQKWIHKVWEQNQAGEWILVHDEEIPLNKKGKENE